MTKKILAVDTDQRHLDTYHAMLQGKNCTLQTANDPFKALSMVKETPNLDTIVARFDMPGMNGAQLLEQVHQINPHATKVLVSDGRLMEEVAEPLSGLIKRGIPVSYLGLPIDERLFYVIIGVE